MRLRPGRRQGPRRGYLERFLDPLACFKGRGKEGEWRGLVLFEGRLLVALRRMDAHDYDCNEGEQ